MRTTLIAATVFSLGVCLLLNLAVADKPLRFTSSSEDGDPLPAPVGIHFKLSEESDLPDTTNGKLPQGSVTQYVESAMTVETDGLNRIQLKLKDGRKIAFEFRIER